jgi:hypothetical protein
MTNDEIIQISRRAYKSCEHIPNVKIPPEFIKRFAALVASAEREACAKVCEDSVEYAGDTLAEAIRARGQA